MPSPSIPPHLALGESPYVTAPQAMDDKQLIDAELEQLEIEQRQLDLDRKKLQLRLRRAKLESQVEPLVVDGQAGVKAEPVEDGKEVERLAAGDELFTIPGLGGPANASTIGDHDIVRKKLALMSSLMERCEPASNSSGENNPRYHHSGIVPTANYSLGTPPSRSPTTEPSQFPHLEPAVPSCTTPSAGRPSLPATSQRTTPLHWQQDGFSHLPASSPHKRGRSVGGESGDWVSEKNSTPSIKDEKTWTNDRPAKPAKPAQRKKNKPQPRAQRLPEHHTAAIIRKYGERLVQRHMQSFRTHERSEANQIINAGSKIVDGLLEKKFKSLEELHDECERQIRLRCNRNLQESLIFELQKFRRAAPVWWRKCLKKRAQGERLEDVTAVFQDVREGIFDEAD